MASFRLAFHGSVLTRALSQSLQAPSLEQRSLLAHQMADHLEALDTAATSAASIIASMQGLLLQVTGLTGLSVSPGLQSLPFSGELLFGPQLRLYLAEAAQLSLQAQQLRASSSGRSSKRMASSSSGSQPKRTQPPSTSQPQSRPAPAPAFRKSIDKGSQGRGAPKGGSPAERR